MAKFYRVNETLIPQVWPEAEPLLAKGILGRIPTYSTNRLFDMCMTDVYQLWVAVSDDDQIIAAAVTRLHEDELAKTCAIITLGGQDVKDWLHLLDQELTHFAEENNCDQIEAMTRPGFSRLVPNFIEEGRIYVKLLK